MTKKQLFKEISKQANRLLDYPHISIDIEFIKEDAEITKYPCKFNYFSINAREWINTKCKWLFNLIITNENDLIKLKTEIDKLLSK